MIEYFGNSIDKSCILLEYMPFSLFEVAARKLPIKLVKFIMLELLKGIQYLHSLHIAHGDLKPENTLISKEFKVKICDLGFAKYFQGKSLVRGGSMGFTAPEIHHPNEYDITKCDVFALGIIYFVLTT